MFGPISPYSGSGGGATQLLDLADVDPTGAADLDLLMFDAATGKWVPKNRKIAGADLLPGYREVWRLDTTYGYSQTWRPMLAQTPLEGSGVLFDPATGTFTVPENPYGRIRIYASGYVYNQIGNPAPGLRIMRNTTTLTTVWGSGAGLRTITTQSADIVLIAGDQYRVDFWGEIRGSSSSYIRAEIVE